MTIRGRDLKRFRIGYLIYRTQKVTKSVEQISKGREEKEITGSEKIGTGQVRSSWKNKFINKQIIKKYYNIRSITGTGKNTIEEQERTVEVLISRVGWAASIEEARMLINNGQVKINGWKTRAGRKLDVGDKIEMRVNGEELRRYIERDIRSGAARGLGATYRQQGEEITETDPLWIEIQGLREGKLEGLVMGRPRYDKIELPIIVNRDNIQEQQ